MKIVDVRNYGLRSVAAEALKGYVDGEPFKFLRQDPVLRNNWISFTAVDWNAGERCLYLGLTAFDGDIFWRFWPDTGAFESLGFPRVNDDPQNVKIHRGLTPDGQGGYYFGTAALPDIDERLSSPGGAIYHYREGQFECLGIPAPHDYIQNIEVDLRRGRVYGVTYPVIQFFDYDIAKRRTSMSLFTGSHFHESGLDDAGFFWGTYSGRRGHCLMRYHPDQGAPEFFETPIPNLDPNHIFTFPMNGPVDSFINGGDGYLYFGTTLGELYRLDPRSGEARLLGRPSTGIRLSGLTVGPDGKLLGSYGAYNETGLFLYDRATGDFEDLGRMANEQASCFMIHDITWDGGNRVFAAETDNVDRSSYLWVATLGEGQN